MITRTLGESAGALPSEFAAFRVVPSLVSALEYGGASAAATVPLVIRLGKNVPDTDYERVVLTPLIKLYANPDRGIRMALLEQLPEYSDKLDKKMVVDKIWPHLVCLPISSKWTLLLKWECSKQDSVTR